jgi:preprotein translocase subunit SecD
MLKFITWFAAATLGTAALITAATAQPARDFSIAGEQFSEADIVDARALPALDGSASIMITFSDAAAKRLGAVTKATVKKIIRVTLDGKLLAEPLVLEPIDGGAVQITGGLAMKDATVMAKRISGKDPLPDSLDEEE